MSSQNDSPTHLFKTNFYNALVQITPHLPKHVFIHCKPAAFPNHILLTLEKNSQNSIEDYALQLREMGIDACYLTYNEKNCLAVSANDFMTYAELLAAQESTVKAELLQLSHQQLIKPTVLPVA